jgi:hypothetical protein
MNVAVLDIDLPPPDRILDLLTGNGVERPKVVAPPIEAFDFAVQGIPSVFLSHECPPMPLVCRLAFPSISATLPIQQSPD